VSNKLRHFFFHSSRKRYGARNKAWQVMSIARHLMGRV